MHEPALRYRAIFISDVHLGSAACQAEAVQSFLYHSHAEFLYLVGDIIDLWVSRRKGKWRQAHTNVIRTVLGKTKYGTKVFITPGNHDAELRRMNGIEFESIFIDHQFVHVTLEGKKLLVVHGDFFDRSVTSLRAFAVVGSWLHESMTVMNLWTNNAREKVGLKPSDFSTTAKQRVKNFVSYFTNFEERITVDSKNQGFDGVVCGHVHRPALSLHEETGALYINTGDWMKHCTALVEHLDGRLELLHWSDVAFSLGGVSTGAGTSTSLG